MGLGIQSTVTGLRGPTVHVHWVYCLTNSKGMIIILKGYIVASALQKSFLIVTTLVMICPQNPLKYLSHVIEGGGIRRGRQCLGRQSEGRSREEAVQMRRRVWGECRERDAFNLRDGRCRG